ncbi:hypothetical protein BIY24_08235 [Halobacteriovorax marinus]|uniref:hypothetical protein n=1 Tax=Halobacteriovorax marinus TaxID=97084 RepID=UPI000BC35041|nr:hypothetical protein [Halobacteriovorax marinus]ATH07938.1 hypothetical protein BIY24_08235 [Halobacteriovorax marinus]
MKQVISIAFAQENKNYDEIVEFRGEKVRLTQYAIGFNYSLARTLIEKYDGICDVICLSGVPPRIQTKSGVIEHPSSQKLKSLAKVTPLVDGQLLKNIYIPWAFRQYYLTNKSTLENKSVSMYTGALQKNLVDIIEELGGNLCLADPYFFLRMPYNLHSNNGLEKFLRTLFPVMSKMKFKESTVATFRLEDQKIYKGLKEFFKGEIFVGNEGTIQIIDKDHLKGKTVVLDFMGTLMKERLIKAGVKDCISCMPKVVKGRYVNFSVLEALMQAFQPDSLSADDILWWISELDLKVEHHQLSEDSKSTQSTDKFAFIIHPLSKDYLFKHPLLKKLKPAKKQLGGILEKALTYTPGFFYGKISGIISDGNGKEVEGLIYTVSDTPKMLMEQNPEKVYKKLVDICKDAKKNGANIIGLGAFTKIVGDAGISVEQRSPIPVTTGNSLSACSTLWAAKFAVDKIGLVKKKSSTWQGKVMVIGATGAIGAVSAKVLATRWKELVLVAPRAYKLLELKEEIEAIAPNCKVSISTSPNKVIKECDLIITTTSARGKKILDIKQVKPGAVICDVSRPFDISEEDAASRPDVMVIASGEVQLPGHVKSKVDLGLEGNIVYACLAETALLAMDGKIESFTLGRNISYEKVLEIDRMAKEHGVKLSAIMGHNGFISNDEFKLCKEHALKKRNQDG